MKCKSILIVEDDQNIQAAIKEALELDGYEHVFTANNGKEALDLLLVIEKPCVILLDVMMPIMDGWEFLKIARESQGVNAIATIPVVIVSAARDAEQMAHKSGAAGFVKKPIDLNLLFKSIDFFCE
jgi:CheY-like chemotaxis protein